MLGQELLRVVVVDDSAETTEVMTALLNANGYVAKDASDATSALGLIQKWLPHCVLLDIDMPGIDGVELALHIRANYGRTMTLIALSGWDASHPRVREISGIVDHCLCKPCNLQQLVALLEPLRAWR